MCAIISLGMLSSTTLISCASQPPEVTVSQLWVLGGDSPVTVSGLLVNVWSYDSGTEILVMMDGSGETTVKVVCSPGPWAPPSASLSIGDLVVVSGDCAFEDGVPVVFCHYGGVSLSRRSQDVLTVSTLCGSWRLFEGDRIDLRGVLMPDDSGALRLHDGQDVCSIAVRLAPGVNAVYGNVLARCVLEVDVTTMEILLLVDALDPAS